MQLPTSAPIPAQGTKLSSAIEYAQQAANRFALPQTVYRNTESCGWWHTHTFARFLAEPGCEAALTILPERYFL